MQSREKKLAIGLGVVVAVYFGWPMLDTVVFGPLSSQSSEITTFEENIQKARKAQIEQLRASEWVQQHQQCILSGPTGIGKSYG